MSDLAPVSMSGLAFYALLGAVLGLVASGVTRVLHLFESGFARLPIHWMWWPALGAVAVGVVGYFARHAGDGLLQHYGHPLARVADQVRVRVVPVEVRLVVGFTFERDFGEHVGPVIDDRRGLRTGVWRGRELARAGGGDRPARGTARRHGGPVCRRVAGVSGIGRSRL